MSIHIAIAGGQNSRFLLHEFLSPRTPSQKTVNGPNQWGPGLGEVGELKLRHFHFQVVISVEIDRTWQNQAC